MALYWPQQKVALQIDDDPAAKPYEGPADWQVFHTTMAAMDDFDSFDELMKSLADALGKPQQWSRHSAERKRLFDFLMHAESCPLPEEEDIHTILDLKTGDVEEWDQDVPEGSFEALGNGLTMSTPEFYYLREARRRPLLQTIQLAYELCGLYGTDHLENARLYRMYSEPVTSVDDLRVYLGGARGLDGYRHAMQALNYVAEGSLSPAASYLSILLTLPRSLGGYDLFRPKLGVRVVDPLSEESAPTEEGRYEAYDLCWPRQGVALQFVGEELPDARERRALEAPGFADMYVVCVTSRQMADPEAFDVAAQLLAEHLGTPLPPADAAFVAARNQARRDLAFPEYDHMRSMVEDWHWHRDQ